ncbi:MAG: hypothetical protein ACTHK3_09005 [Solirubrobacterales bacterium]
MQNLKKLSLAVAVVVAFTAFTAGTGSATVLCKTRLTEGCAAGGWSYPLGTNLHVELITENKMVLEDLSNTAVTTCSESTFKLPITAIGSETATVDGDPEVLSWGSGSKECSRPLTTLKKGTFEIHWIAGTLNGTLTGSNTELTYNTIMGTCVYGLASGTDLGTLNGGEPASIDFSAIVKKVSGGLGCPSSELRWTAHYIFTEPKALFVSKS